VSKVVGCEVEYAGGGSADARNYRVDGSKIAATLQAFQPQWTVHRGAVQLYEALRRDPITLAEVEGWRYRRISQIERLLDLGQLTPDLRWKGQG
jgi:hypothetical protein